MMIVILSYFRDRSKAPLIHFFPYGPDQGEQILRHVAFEMRLGKRIEAYKLTAVDEDVQQIVVE